MVISSIDFNRVEVYEAGALLITLLAYPREREEVWAQVHASLCSYALRNKVCVGAKLGDSATTDQADLCISPQQDISRDLRTLDRRIRDRMIAGRMGIGFLKEVVTGQVPAGLKRLSINELAELVRDDARYSEPGLRREIYFRPHSPQRAKRRAPVALGQLPGGAQCQLLADDELKVNPDDADQIAGKLFAPSRCASRIGRNRSAIRGDRARDLFLGPVIIVECAGSEPSAADDVAHACGFITDLGENLACSGQIGANSRAFLGPLASGLASAEGNWFETIAVWNGVRRYGQRSAGTPTGITGCRHPRLSTTALPLRSSIRSKI